VSDREIKMCGVVSDVAYLLFSPHAGGSTRRLAGDGGLSPHIQTCPIRREFPAIDLRYASATSPLCVCKKTLRGEEILEAFS